MTCVALIDANRNIREFCRRELVRDGYELALFRTPQEAAARIRDVLPDIVVVDADAFASDAGTFAPLLETLSIPVILHDAAPSDAPLPGGGPVARVVKSGDLGPLKHAIGRAVGSRRRGTRGGQPRARVDRRE